MEALGTIERPRASAAAPPPAIAPLPLTMAAVTVAGQCRERSPGDVALFGKAGERFADRFIDPAAGEAMLAMALAEGAAEGRAELRTGAGRAGYRISLWRQRGGQRIRIMASFAALPRLDCGPAPGCWDRATLRRPLLALIGVAQRLRDRTAPAAPAGDLLAAAWHLVRVIDERSAGPSAPRLAEVDLTRLCGRLARLAEPHAAAAGTVLHPSLDACDGRSVMADEGTLWSVIETMLHAAVDAAPEGAHIRFDAAPQACGDIRIEVSPDDTGGRPDIGGAAAAAAGMGLVLTSAPDGAFPLCLTLPRGQCLAL